MYDEREPKATPGFFLNILLVVSVVIAAILTIAHAAGAATQSATCSWQGGYTGGPGLLDPDTNAEYWGLRFTSAANLTITVNGQYPDARYFSFTSYNAMGVAQPQNEIHDSQIVPNADGTFTVKVSHTPGVNTIPFANTFNGTTGYLLMRVYVPNADVVLPSVTMNGVTYAPCNSNSGGALGVFNNPDNTYISFNPTYPSGNTFDVISGKAPTNVRYWSWCSYTMWTSAVQCKYDSQIPVDSNGYYHIGIGQLSQQSAIENAGYTFIQYGYQVMLRNLLGNQTTGEYAPVITVTVNPA